VGWRLVQFRAVLGAIVREWATRGIGTGSFRNRVADPGPAQPGQPYTRWYTTRWRHWKTGTLFRNCAENCSIYFNLAEPYLPWRGILKIAQEIVFVFGMLVFEHKCVFLCFVED